MKSQMPLSKCMHSNDRIEVKKQTKERPSKTLAYLETQPKNPGSRLAVYLRRPAYIQIEQKTVEKATKINRNGRVRRCLRRIRASRSCSV